MEEMLIRKIKGGIMGILNGTKTPVEAKVGKFLNQLKATNLPMFEELMNDYKAAKAEYDEKNKEQE